MYIKLIFIGLVTVIAFKIYRYIKKSARYFEERNLKYVGASSFFRSLFEIVTGKFDPHETRIKSYLYETPDEP